MTCVLWPRPTPCAGSNSCKLAGGLSTTGKQPSCHRLLYLHTREASCVMCVGARQGMDGDSAGGGHPMVGEQRCSLVHM